MSPRKFWGRPLPLSKANGVWLGERPNMRTKDGDSTRLIVSSPPDLMLGGEVIQGPGIDAEIHPAGIATINADTWYYVYIYADSSGAMAYEVDASAPDGSLKLNSGDDSRRYVGAFRTDGSSNIVPFIMTRGKYTYDFSSGSDFFKSLAGGTTGPSRTLFTLHDSVSGSALLLPPHSRHARIRVNARGDGMSQYLANIYSNGSTGTTLQVSVPESGATIDVAESFDIMTNSSHQIAYSVSDTPQPGVTVWTLGFYE